jgi:hypothetical protein
VTSGNNVTLADANALSLGSSTVFGTLNVTTNGAITQSGPLSVAGITTLSVGPANDITLNNAANDLGTISVTSGNNVTLVDSNAVDLGNATVSSTLSVTAGGAITQAAGTLDANTGTIALTGTGIGTLGSPIQTTAGTIFANAGAGGVFITESDGAIITATTTGGGPFSFTSTLGNLTVNTIAAPGGTVNLATPFGAIQDGNGAANNVTANSLTAAAATGVDLDTTLSNLNSATVSGNGSIEINNSGALAFTNATTANGNITINATAGDLTASTVTAGGASSNATLSTTTSGNVLLGTVSAPNVVTVTSAGAITDSNGGANNITANTATLAATTSIATAADPIQTDVVTLNATNTGGGVFIAEKDAVTINSVLAGGGNIAISNTTGDMTINTLTSTAGRIDLTATAGSILDGNGAANNITAGADSVLRALGGVIGLSADPIEVNINPGTLGVEASGQIAGVSVNVDGTVAPGNTLTVLNVPPGQVIFNGNILNPPAPVIPPINFTWVFSEVNSPYPNENGPLTELVVSNTDDKEFDTELVPCQTAGKLDGKTKVAGCYREMDE